MISSRGILEIERQLNFEVTPRLRERFCKDKGIPIKIFREPYFRDRLSLMDSIFPEATEDYAEFLFYLKKYNSEQEYFEEYNRVKDDAINFIKSSEGFNTFNSLDMNEFSKDIERNISNHDIFKESNVGKFFISIDMIKANFSALCHYDKSIFGNVSSWEEFIYKFTDNNHIIRSKYIRQVVMGNCNPKRQVTYEKYLMNDFLKDMKEHTPELFNNVVFFSNDEIIIDVSSYDDRDKCYSEIRYLSLGSKVPLRVEHFRLGKVLGTDGYFKDSILEYKKEFKCLDSLMYPFIARFLVNEDVSQNDLVFMHDGMMSMLLGVPKISLSFGEGDKVE